MILCDEQNVALPACALYVPVVQYDVPARSPISAEYCMSGSSIYLNLPGEIEIQEKSGVLQELCLIVHSILVRTRGKMSVWNKK